jgi:hypothetical protein
MFSPKTHKKQMVTKQLSSKLSCKNSKLNFNRQKHRFAGAFFMGQALEIVRVTLKLALNGWEC